MTDFKRTLGILSGVIRAIRESWELVVELDRPNARVVAFHARCVALLHHWVNSFVLGSAPDHPAHDPRFALQNTHVMRNPIDPFLSVLPFCALIACGVDTTPGPAPADQAEYSEPEALSCAAMNGRSYAITFANGAPATDTILFASDRMEVTGPVVLGFAAAPYTCSQSDSLGIAAEMADDSTQVLRWSASILGDAMQGTMTLIKQDSTANAVAAFTGRAIAGANATLSTPQRQVERL